MNNFATINEVRPLLKALKALYEPALRGFCRARAIIVSMTSIHHCFDMHMTRPSSIMQIVIPLFCVFSIYVLSEI